MRLFLVSFFAVVALGQRPGADPKPDFPPSREVHISPSTMKEDSASVTSRPDYWTARGFGLKEIIAHLHKVDEDRVIIPTSLDPGKHFDFALVLSSPENDDAIDSLVEQAIQTHFGITIGRENRTMEVYVMTAPRGLPASGSKGTSSGVTITTTSISADNATMQDIRQMLEQHLRRIVLDETGLAGRYEFDIKGIARGTDAFLRALRDNLGLDLTRTQREVEVVIVRAH